MNIGGIAVVTGSGSGLGKLIKERLEKMGWEVFGVDIADGHDVANPRVEELPPFCNVLVNCAGTNKIDWLQDVEDWDWDQVMNTNAKGIMKMTKALLPALRQSKGAVLNIVSDAAHKPMRCSAAYNASKGAALILTKQLARELISDGITVFSVSPNKLKDTGMSDDIDEQVMKTRGWSREEAHQYQTAGLLTGEETDPNDLAEFITFLLSEKRRHRALAGCDIPYGA